MTSRSLFLLPLLALATGACERAEIDVSAVPDRAQATLPGTISAGRVVAECKALVTIINESVTKMNQPAQGGLASAELTRLATDMEDTVARLDRVQLTDEHLERLADRYKAMAAKISASATGLAKAVEGFDPQGIQASEKHFETALALEDPLVSDLNQYCQRPR